MPVVPLVAVPVTALVVILEPAPVVPDVNTSLPPETEAKVVAPLGSNWKLMMLATSLALRLAVLAVADLAVSYAATVAAESVKLWGVPSTVTVKARSPRQRHRYR